ncbi:hypothetical protein [Coleofasciculus sp. FACHB-SPT9]|uniref:hypothetical protein n=1 Tax=Cyanophyceae TaxID=3028117 RepID=UPI00168663D9|nr:hypothetical protein [Coleofasciculus sp. FACHB-SPT9]MBD1889488.1 hypothetical protein [Coleofasciculus sp. FACHB-SPT9]
MPFSGTLGKFDEFIRLQPTKNPAFTPVWQERVKLPFVSDRTIVAGSYTGKAY